MKLLRLTLPAFWYQDDLVLNAESAGRYDDDGPACLFLAGPNGSGKSRILESLGRIFRGLASGHPAGFPYELEYELHGARLLVTTMPPVVGSKALGISDRVDQVGAWLLRTESPKSLWTQQDVARWSTGDVDRWVPRKVVGISGGPTSRLGRALNPQFDPVTGRKLDAGVGEDDSAKAFEAPEARCLSLGVDELRLVALALLSHGGVRDPEAGLTRAEILDRIGLDVDQPLFAFTLRLPYNWYERAGGEAAQVERLLERATRRVLVGPAEVSYGDDVGESDRLAVFEVGAPEHSWTVDDLVDDPWFWFERLVAWQRRGAISDVQLVLQRAGKDGGLILVDELSDGEFLMLGRYGVLILLAGRGGSLFLMDEPDTHFNDWWKGELVAQLTSILRSASEPDAVILATHSDLTLRDARVPNIRVVDRARVRSPLESPFAADRERISQIVANKASPEQYSDQVVQRTLDTGDPQAIADMIQQTGPGIQRFRLRYALRDEREDAG